MTKFSSAFIAAAAIATMSAFPKPAAAAIEYPWCAQYSGEDGGGGRNCGFVSYEQCMQTVRGMGGGCEQNLFYLDQQSRKQRRVRQPPQQH